MSILRDVRKSYPTPCVCFQPLALDLPMGLRGPTRRSRFLLRGITPLFRIATGNGGFLFWHSLKLSCAFFGKKFANI